MIRLYTNLYWIHLCWQLSMPIEKYREKKDFDY